MTKRLLSRAALLPALAVLSTAAAPKPVVASIDDLVSRDQVECLGDNDLTVDTLGFQEWLDLTRTTDLSWEELTGPAHDCNPTCTTGPFAGWWFASQWDVLALLNHAGLALGRSDYEAFSQMLGFWPKGKTLTRSLEDPSTAVALRFYEDYEVICVEDPSTPGFFCYTEYYPAVERSSFGVGEPSAKGAWLFRWNFGPFPTAGFHACHPIGPAPLTVGFRDQSIGGNAWHWDFGDGSTSNDRSPTHEYTTAGIYTVRQTIEDTGGNEHSAESVVKAMPPSFFWAAVSAVQENRESVQLVKRFWRFDDAAKFSRPWLLQHAENAERLAAGARTLASGALDDATTFWGRLASEYVQTGHELRQEAVALLALVTPASDRATRDYYTAAAVSLSAAADLYNAAVIWCAAVEAGVEDWGPGQAPASPSFLGATYNAFWANLYLANAIAYSFYLYAMDDPGLASQVAAYAATSRDYARMAYDEAAAALAAQPGENLWSRCAVDNGLRDLGHRAHAVAELDMAATKAAAGDLDAARAHLMEAYAGGAAPADLFNATALWCASLASEGGRK